MKKSIWAILFVFVFGLLPSCKVNAEVVNNYEHIELPVKTDSGSQSLYKEKTDSVEVFNSEGRAFTVTNQDIDLMAKVVWAESNSEPYEGKVAVASVILNRLRNKQFPKSIDGVIKQKYAFSCVIDGDVRATPDKTCYNAVFDALEGKDPTVNALYFYNPKTARSGWMLNVKKNNVKPIGNHVFFIAD